MQVRIDALLTAIETAERVRILYAVESGSRAWGFASTNSDWDVRFIYVRSLDGYLSVRNPRDVLEMPIDDGLDASGWDIRKALHLLGKSNPPLLEWLRSPLVYREALTTTERLRKLSCDFFSPVSCMHHYLRMAERNYREYLQREKVWLKKYFYVLRPVLACCWIEQHGSMPPMEFGKLVDDQMPDEVRPALDQLLQRKRSGDELDEGPRIPEINAFVEETIGRLRVPSETLAGVRRPDPSVLDSVFRECLAEAWDLRDLSVAAQADGFG
jgi:predicted nucleotidyltransferase